MKRDAFGLVVGIIIALAVVVVVGAAMHIRVERGDPATKPRKTTAYLANPQRTQLYRTGAKGDAVLYRVVDMPREKLRCVMLVGSGVFGRAVSCVPLP